MTTHQHEENTAISNWLFHSQIADTKLDNRQSQHNEFIQQPIV
jgi:hypothetical protein